MLNFLKVPYKESHLREILMEDCSRNFPDNFTYFTESQKSSIEVIIQQTLIELTQSKMSTFGIEAYLNNNSYNYVTSRL